MQIRMRLFKRSTQSPKIIEWYFENVFGKMIGKKEWSSISNYKFAQCLLNISFIDYDLAKIEPHLKMMKDELMYRISSEKVNQITTKDLVQMVSSVCRMNLVFLKNTEDLEIMREAAFSILHKMNIIDLQSVLNGFSIVYQGYSYHPNLLTPLIETLKANTEPINSLTLTNIMKSLNSLRIDDSGLYDYVVEAVEKNHFGKGKKLDNIALVYTFARLVRLNQIPHAEKLLKHYHEKLDLFTQVVNPHNTCQLLLSLAVIKNYEEEHWKNLIEHSDQSYLENYKREDYFRDSARVAFALCELEAPELFNEYVKNTELFQIVQDYEGERETDPEITTTQKAITEACEALGYKVEKEVMIKSKQVDIFLPELGLAVEYDGPNHFLNGTDIHIGSSMYTSRLLGGEADVISVPYYEISNCGDLNLSRLFLGTHAKQQVENLKTYESMKDYMKEKIDAYLEAKGK
jgi:hypothetical protein